MEVYLFNPTRFQLLYNCSFYNVSRIPLEEREHPYWGTFYLVFYVIFMALYIPCLWAMCVSELRHGTTYKLMIQLGFTQLIGLQFAGLNNGLQTVRGTVFCSAPDFEYISCCMTCTHWVVSTTTCDILGFNRLCELYSSEFAHRLFGGRKLYIWMIFPLIYGSYIFMYMPPNIFNAYMLAYFANPHYGYFDDPNGTYLNYIFSFHDTAICTAEVLIHIGMPILYFRALRVGSEELQSKIRYEKQIYFQVILIGVLNFSTSLMYIVIQVIPPSIHTNLAANIGYFFTQGMASVVYLCFNRSIRKTILNKLKNYRGQFAMLSSSDQTRVFQPSPTSASTRPIARNRVQTY